MELNSKYIPIVREFLRLEAGDFAHRLITEYDINRWVGFRMDAIIRGLETYKGKADYIVINSYSNLGTVNRTLTLTATPWDMIGNVVIALCTCGMDNCWGTITFPDKTSVGRKGVMPL